MSGPHRFDEAERAAVYRAIAERRDMRHFRPDPVDPQTLQRLLAAAHRAPSVGMMQPWRFLRITDPALPDGAKPVAVLCLGHVEAFYERPMLEEEGWTRGRPLEEMVFENRWGRPRHENDPNEGEP